MDRINNRAGSEPLYNQQAPSRFGPAPAEAVAAPAYQPDSFSRVRQRTAEQAAGVKPLDLAGIISMAVGAAGVLGGVGVLGAMIMGAAVAGPATMAFGLALAVCGAVPLAFGLARFFARKKLIEEG